MLDAGKLIPMRSMINASIAYQACTDLAVSAAIRKVLLFLHTLVH